MVKFLLVFLSAIAVTLGPCWAQSKSTPFSPAPVSREVMEANKKTALEFYDLAINKKTMKLL